MSPSQRFCSKSYTPPAVLCYNIWPVCPRCYIVTLMSQALALPPQWALFVDRVTLGHDPTDAAALAGYEDSRRAAATLMRHPTVRMALVQAAQARLEGRALPMALDTIESILGDETAPRAVRAKLAVAVLDRALAAKGGPQDQASKGGKALQDMTLDELAQVVRSLESAQELASQTLDVTPEVIATGEPIP